MYIVVHSGTKQKRTPKRGNPFNSFAFFSKSAWHSVVKWVLANPCKGTPNKPDRKNVDFSRFFPHLPYDDSLDFIMVYHNLLLLLLLRARLHLLLLLLTTASWPQPRAPDLQRALDHEHQISVGTAGPQPRAPDLCGWGPAVPMAEKQRTERLSK